MRTLKDRLHHTVLFEAIALVLVATFGAWLTGHSIEEMAMLGLMFSIMAMVWNLVFNWAFDHWDARVRNGAPRGPGIRVLHAVLFEAVLLVAGLFLTAWWLGISYLNAFLLDLGFSAFFLVYAFAFNWAYDIVYPVRKATPA